MNDSNTNIRLMPKRAIVVYENKRKDNYYLESREIKNADGKYILMAPVPLASNVLKEVARSYMKKNSFEMSFGGLIDEHLLYGINKPGLTAVMWYRKATQRSLNFSASLKIKGASSVQIPATLYLVVNTNLYLYALMTSDRPDLKTKIYNAPFFNIYEDGNVCLGTAPIGRQKGKTFEKEAERFERGFYMAEQNHGAIKNQCKTALSNLWTRLIKTKAAFPSKQELIQHPKYKTVGDLVQKLIGQNSNDDDYDEED